MSRYISTPSGVLVPEFAAKTSRPEMHEIATTRDGRDITRGYLDPLLLQQPSDDVLQVRGAGDYTVYKELLRDDQVGACFQQRRLAVVSKETTVDPGGKRPIDIAAADSIREQMDELGWDRATDKMLFGVFYGFAVAEAMWAKDGRHVTLADIKVRDRRRFGFDGLGRLRLKTTNNPMGELLPEQKFWAFSTGADHDDEPYGLGLAHWLYWPTFFKKAGLRYWLVFLERFGQPTAKGEYPVNAKPEDQQKLLDALQAISTDTGIIVPQGMTIGLLEAARSGTADYSSLYDKMDAAIAKMTLGQVASTQGTPGRLGNDELQGDVRQDLIKADADLVCESFNRSLVRWLTDWNYPGAAYPRVYRNVELDEDLAQRAARDKTIVDMGFKPAVGYINETYGGEWEEKAVSAEPVVVPQFAAPTATTPIAQQMLEQSRTQLEPATNMWIEQVRALTHNVSSLEELRDQLLELYPDLSLERYAQALAEAGAAAHLAGRDAAARSAQ